MKAYSWFALKRFMQMIVVIFVGVSVAFLISHLSPVNPVESMLGRITARSNFSPEAIEEMRSALTDLYGVDKPLPEQYANFWRRFVQGDFGPSLLAFPTPSMTLVMRALPWTVFLLSVSVLVTWSLGNLFGGLAGYFQNNRLLKVFGVAAMGVQPIPYYIVAFLFLIFFGFVWPILPISGAYAMDVEPGWNIDFILSVIQHAILPVTSLIVVGFGTWFLGMRALVSNIVTEDYVTYAELAGVPRKTRGHLLRDAQRRRAAVDGAGAGARLDLLGHDHHRTGLHLSRPGHAAGRCGQQRRQHHGARRVDGFHHRRGGGDLHRRSAASASRSADQDGVELMFVVVRDLIRYNREFLIGLVLVTFIVGVLVPELLLTGGSRAAVSWFRPTSRPRRSTGSAPTRVGRTSSGRPRSPSATRSPSACIVAVLSRIISITVGLIAGYVGGWFDRALMSINDIVVALPIFPILVLFYFVLRDDLDALKLAIVMACFGWPFDARLIRSVALSLRHREFTRHAVFAGMSARKIMFEEHLPYVMPIVFATAHGQHDLVDRAVGDARRARVHQHQRPDDRHDALLGQQPLGDGGGHMVVDRRSGRPDRHHLHRPLPARGVAQRIHRPALTPAAHGQLMTAATEDVLTVNEPEGLLPDELFRRRPRGAGGR